MLRGAAKSTFLLLVLLGAWGTATWASRRMAPDASVADGPSAPTLAPALFPDGVPVAIEATPAGLPNISAQGCNACHFDIHDDWAASPHGQSSHQAVMREAAARTGGSTACMGCHLPLVNQHAELATGYHEGDLSRPQMAPNPIWDATLAAEGVTCAACHIRDGKIIATRAVPDAPHPMAISLELTTSDGCATCHQLTWPGADKPLYDTHGEWSRSAYATAGVRCQDCHMPPKAGLATASRFAASPSHRLSADLSRALSILVDLDSPILQRGQDWPMRVRVQNTGAGHHVPTGSPFRALVLRFEIVDAKGKTIGEGFEHVLARTLSEAAPWTTLSDTRLAAGGELSLDHSFQVAQRVAPGPAVLQISGIDRTADGDGDPQVLQRIPIELR
jgi:nitrate/TMAO reductase-like tetraheme cytochrome c subunit